MERGAACRAVALAMLASALCVGVTLDTASAQRVRTIARVIASSDVRGRFAHPVCHRGRTLIPAEQAAFTYALARAAASEDRPMVLDTGGLLTPGGVARYAADERPSSLAHMVRQLGYRALTFGQSELAAPREGLLRVVAELRERGIPMIASNLRCGLEAEALCDQLVDASDGPSLHDVADQRMAVLSVLSEDALLQVAPDRRAGITFESPADTLARLTAVAREQGATLVVAVVDSAVEGGPLGLASSLPDDARPDLVLVSSGGDLLFARPRTLRPVLVGAPEDDAVEVSIRESDELRHDGLEMLAQPLGGRGITVAEPVLRWIDRIGDSYCEAWGRPLEGGHVEEPIDADGMLRLAASIVRTIAGADVAILNRGVLDSAWRPAHEGALTASDVYVALEYDEPLQVAEVDADWLEEVARRAESTGALVTPGLTWTGSGGGIGIEIAGHAAESRATYRVVTIRFLSAGGDGALPALPSGERWMSLGDATLRSVVLHFLEREHPLDPRRRLPDPEETVQWLFRGSADLTFSGSSVGNPQLRCTADTPPGECVDGFVVSDGVPRRAYSTSLLNRSDTLTFGVTIDLAAEAAAPDWTWQNGANLVYRTAWVEGVPGRPGVFAEAADQVRGRSTFAWRGLRQGNDQWYVPDPMLDVFVESELTEPPDRQWHWFLLRPSAGVRLQLLDKLQLQLLAGLEMQPFDPAFEVEPGVGATLTLSPWDLFKLEDRFARLSFTIDYFLADLGEDNRSQLRGQLDGAFDLAGPLAIVFSLRVFVQAEEGQDLGSAIDATAGLRLGYVGRSTGP